MVKEIEVRVDSEASRAFYEALKNHESLQNLNPDIATRYAIDERLYAGQTVSVTASQDDGPMQVHVDDKQVTNHSAMTRRGLESVVEVYSRGRGSQIASSMLNGGSILVLRKP